MEEELNQISPLSDNRNPFDNGIAKAIQQSRANLEMTRDQEHKAINNAVLNFGNAISQEPVQKGFLNNLGIFGRSMNPALQAYNASEDKALKENEQLSNQLLKNQRDQELFELKKEDLGWNRNFKQKQLEETQRYHNLLDNFKRTQNGNNSDNAEFDQIAPLIRTNSAFDKVGTKTDKAAEFYEEVSNLNNKYNDLKTTMQKAGIDITNPFVFNKALREADSWFGSFTKDPTKLEISSKFADVKASNKRAMQVAEKALKDGALTDFTVRYGDQNKLYPSFGEEHYTDYERKLNGMLENAKHGYEASNLSLQTGRHINKENYKLIKQLQERQKGISEIDDPEEDNRSVEPNFATMIDKQGNQYMIPENEVNDALNDGLTMQ